MLDMVFRLPPADTAPAGIPSFVAATTAYDAGDGSLVLPYPSGWQAGDAIIAYATNQYGTGVQTPVFPAGWTAQRADVIASGAGIYTRTRVLSGGDTPSITITRTGAGDSSPMLGVALLYRNPQSPLVNTSVFAEDTIHQTVNDQNNLPSVTPTRNGLLVGLYLKRTDMDNITLPAGMTLRAFRCDNTTTGNAAITLNAGFGLQSGFTVAVAEKPAASGVASGSLTATWTSTGFFEQDHRFGQVLVI